MRANIQSAVLRYLNETLGLTSHLHEAAASEQFPFAIRNQYSFSELEILGRKFPLLTELREGEISPAAIAKHLNWIEEHTGRRGVFACATIQAFNRKRLVEQKVPFVVPGNQIYLPDLGIDFREHLKAARRKKSTVAPSAQLVLLAYLLRIPGVEAWTATFLAKRLRSTKMTMSRAIDDLESHELIEVVPEWREKPIRFAGDRRILWEKALPHLRSPVLKHVYVENADWQLGAIAGLSALSELSMLAAPSRRVRALTGQEWKAQQADANVRIIPNASRDLAPLELEIWRYDPQLLSGSGIVDPLSLYLSLKNETDERTEAALAQLLETVPW